MERKEEIYRLIEERLSQVEIARKLGVTRQAISKYIISRGWQKWYHSIKREKPKKPLKRKPEIDELIEKELNQREIAEALNKSCSSISLYISSRDLQGRYYEIQRKKLEERKVRRKEEIERLVEEGLTRREIGQRLGVNSSRISQLIYE